MDHGLEDPSDDIQIISFNIVNRLSEHKPELLFSDILGLTNKLNRTFESFKKKIANIKEGDRGADTLRAAVRCVK